MYLKFGILRIDWVTVLITFEYIIIKQTNKSILVLFGRYYLVAWNILDIGLISIISVILNTQYAFDLMITAGNVRAYADLNNISITLSTPREKWTFALEALSKR